MREHDVGMQDDINEITSDEREGFSTRR